ncbi:MAG: GLPGLI family protein [Spirosoma sp.]|nr:GLPGLI family protein [Spirosoma sp.]
MKYALLTTLATVAITALLYGQTPTSGKITYEAMRQIDPSQMRMVVNGQEVRPGSPDAPEGMPDVISFTQKLVFSGTMAKEERDRQPNITIRQTRDGAPGGPGAADRRERRMNGPFEQQTYLDLANRKRIDILTIRKDSASQTYRADKGMPTATDWTTTGKTKKIAGYTCQKATALRRKQTYTIWYTTELPFTYSPIADLTPPTGVVLQIESDSESFKATGVSSEAIAGNTVQPPADAKVISDEEMQDMRKKGMADFRQRMMQNGGWPGRERN